ncbi:MAG: SUMF1/EgtB/PvdO family nonheme iron enzyme [bacterium]|nr:SUMF1/EgtB/PvdO family nonheme iron enzyme [bacterium]
MTDEMAYALASEGFREVFWGTRHSDIPWEWSNDGFGQMCYVRGDEEFEVFGIRAQALTYTFRNLTFYGVRSDFAGTKQNGAAEAALRVQYLPLAPVQERGEGQLSWQTAQSSVWLTPASEETDGTIFLWGRHRMYADDVDRPIYHALPPALNTWPGRYQPRTYVCYRASGPIRIDGKLDEKAWRDAQWSQLFEDHQAPYAPSPWKTTRFKMLYDDEFLYFGAQMQEENVWGRLSERDCVIYHDNDFEVFLDATADGVGYYEFEMNALNTVWDMFHETDYHRASALHTLYDVTGLRHAVDVQGTLNCHHDEDVGWTVEVRWPLTSLLERNDRVKLPIERGDMWRLNFSRVQYMHIYDRLVPAMVPKSPCEDWIWQSTGTGDLHNPEMWGKVLFSDRPAGTVVDGELERGFALLAEPARTGDGEADMILLPACTFTMGPDPTDAARSPAHEVPVEAMWMDRCPVTVAQYTVFLNAGGHDKHYSTWMRIPEHCGIRRLGPGQYECVAGREAYPVVYVTVEGAAAYAAHNGKQLPSEAQWERAARGEDGRIYAWGNQPIDPSYANYDFHYGGTTVVGSFPRGATPEGILDLTGNVKEITTSLFEPYPGGEPMIYLGMREPFIYETITRLPVMRGGAWTKQQACMAAAYRDAHGSLNLGFRCIRSA